MIDYRLLIIAYCLLLIDYCDDGAGRTGGSTANAGWRENGKNNSPQHTDCVIIQKQPRTPSFFIQNRR